MKIIKKFFLFIFLFIFNLNASFFDFCNGFISESEEQSNIFIPIIENKINVKEKPKKEDLEQKLKKFIDTNDSIQLNNFLNSINAETKTKLLSGTMEALDKEKNIINLDLISFAIHFCTCEIIKILINHGINCNLINQEGFTPINLAIELNKPDIIEILIKNGANLNLAGQDGFSPLNRAVSKNLPNIIELLVKYGVDINSIDKNENKALDIAYQKSYTNLIPLLKKLGANLDLNNKYGFNLINICIDQNNIEMLKTLAKNGANLNLSGSDGFSPLCRAVINQYLENIKLLINLGADVNLADDNGNTPLDIAIQKNYTDIFSLLIKYGAKISTISDNGNSPLYNAVNNNNTKLVEELLKNGENINTKYSNGDTLLHLAIEKTYNDIVTLLVNSGANVYIKNDYGVNPILLAASYGKKDILKILLKNQDPFIEDLEKAISLNDISAFKLLLEFCKKNIFAESKPSKSFTYYALWLGDKDIIENYYPDKKSLLNSYLYSCYPLHWATIFNNEDLVKYFVEKYNADINIKDYYGFTPLHYAAIYGNYELVEYLIKKKAIVNQKSTKKFNHFKEKLTPCDLALIVGNSDIADLLNKNDTQNNSLNKSNIESKQTSHLNIFIDFNTENIEEDKHILSVNKAFSKNLQDFIKQKACSAIIIGQHLLTNALKLSCSLKDWNIIEFKEKELEGYIIIPKRIQERDAGFNFSLIEHKYVDEEYVKQKQILQLSYEKRTNLSKIVPYIINSILLPKERYIYLGGHGWIQNNPEICGLLKTDAISLLKILDKKNTNIVYLDSCFAGGNNIESIENFDNMILISSATTEISVRSSLIIPIFWRSFFNGLSTYKNYNKPEDFCQNLSDNILPYLITYKPNISNFPHIKFPKKSSILLPINNQAMAINSETIDNCKINNLISVADKRVLEINVEQIKNNVEIKRKIPFLTSNLDKNIFEKIYIDAFKEISNSDLIYVFKKLTKAKLFKNSILENNILIKELKFPFKIALDIKNNLNNKLPETLYNVVICRGPKNKCTVFLSTNKNINKDNSISLNYDGKTHEWITYYPLSIEEFNIYKLLT